MAVSIPALHASGRCKITGEAQIAIANRAGPGSGTFAIVVTTPVQFNPPADPYPTGTILLRIDLNDGAVGSVSTSSIELINSHGRVNPTVALTGRMEQGGLRIPGRDLRGLRYWLLIANNKKPTENVTADIVGFAIHDNLGDLVAYGTGPVRSGDLTVTNT